MLKRVVLGWVRVGRIGRVRRGSVAPIFAVMSLPVAMSVGVGVDMTRLTLAQSSLQSAVDGAALAAARAGGDQPNTSRANATATTVATNFFQGAAPGSAATMSSPTFPSTATSYQVSLSAQGTVKTVFLGASRYIGLGTDLGSITIKAQATASNSATPGSQQAAVKPVLNSGNVSASASDWNSAYLYPVPYMTDGVTPDFASYPAPSQFYPIGTNCPQGNGHLCGTAAGQSCTIQGAATTFPPITANQPLAILVVNMTGGVNSYGNNSFGAATGSCQVFTSAKLSLQQPPSQDADISAAKINGINAAAILAHTIVATAPPQGLGKTTYSTVNQATANDCALIVQVVDPNNLPTIPPYSGSCYSSSDATETHSGKQYANLSCAQMTGRTFMYWFNDMGGGGDDKDYNDLAFSIKCVVPAGSGGGSGPTNSNLTVSLVK